MNCLRDWLACNKQVFELTQRKGNKRFNRNGFYTLFQESSNPISHALTHRAYWRLRLCASRNFADFLTFVLKEIALLSNVRFMSRRFSIEVSKDYFNFASAHFL